MDLSPLQSRLSQFKRPTFGISNKVSPRNPFADQAKQEETQQTKRFQPLKVIFDLLQRGQYLTANIADEIEQSARNGTPLGEATVNTLKAALAGITGERKGDWETLLFGGDIQGGGKREGWIPGTWGDEPLIRWGGEGATGIAEGIGRPRKLLGLAANILLDPTTYIGFGAGAMAKQAAKKYADDFVKLTLATTPAEELVSRFGTKIRDVIGSDKKALIEKINTHGSDIGKKWLEDTYNKAYQTALRNPLIKLQEQAAPLVDKLKGTGGQVEQGLQDLVSRIEGGLGYAGAGTREWRFMGKPFAQGERYPTPLRSWDTLKSNFEKTKVGNKLGDAWWSIMNRGPVGEIRKALGFRNPYEQMLHVKELSIKKDTDAIKWEEAAKVMQTFQGFSDDEIKKAVGLRIEAGKLSQAGKPVTIENLLTPVSVREAPIAATKHGVKPEEISRIRELDARIQQVMDGWAQSENEALQSAGLDTLDTIVNYFPARMEMGEFFGTKSKKGGGGSGSGQQVLQHKKEAISQHIEDAIPLWKWLGGADMQKAADQAGEPIDDFVRQFIVDRDLASTPLDLREAMTYRAIAHSKIIARTDMIKQFSEFGVSKDLLKAQIPDIDAQLEKFGGGLPQLGLYQVKAPGFEDKLFDKEVADILTRTSAITDAGEGSRWFLNAFGAFTSWWKSVVVTTTGFTARNWFSNNITGFLKHGPDWFNASKWFGPTIAGVMYGLHPDNYVDLLKNELKVSEGWIAKQLNTHYGDMTLKEIVDAGRHKGVISHATQVQDAKTTAAELSGAEKGNFSPLSTEFKVFRGARALNTFVENSSRFQSFLMDYMQYAGKGTTGTAVERLAANKQYIDYAAEEARKWFIDYQDLTPQEEVLKKIIPFYSWLRHNIANQISGLTLYPEMYSLVPKTRNAMTEDEGFDYRILPEYMKNLNMYPMGKRPDGTRIMFNPNFPIQDINKIPLLFEEGKLLPRLNFQESVDDIVAAAHPLIKSAIEMVSGRQTWEKRPIEEKMRAPEIVQYFGKPIMFLDGMMRAAGHGQGIGAKIGKDGGLQISGQVARFLENNVPALRTIDLLATTGKTLAGTVNPDLELWIEKVTGKKDYYKGLEEIFQLVSKWGGVKFKAFDEEEAATRRYLSLQARSEELKRQATKDRAVQDIRTLRSRRARETKARRTFGP